MRINPQASGVKRLFDSNIMSYFYSAIHIIVRNKSE